MKVIEKTAEISACSRELHQKGEAIGLVPTMGLLHEGHLSLIRESKRITSKTIVSIFVNPAQFGPKEDYHRYPRDIEGDIKKCRETGADLLFLPSVEDIYLEGYRTYVDVDGLSDKLCGRSRPKHFRGVATIVTKLFNIIGPDKAFFGQKDYQQAIIIKRLASDLNLGVDIIVMPTVREADGLAMSSRNSYLNSNERDAARILYRSLMSAEAMIRSGKTSSEEVRAKMEVFIASEGSAKIEYISIADPGNLEDIDVIAGDVLVAIAVWIGKTRLIDNIIVKGDKS
ncbi:MAG TPA: pantoate--beta-alanine ligase [Nitrospiria bacterium]|nr:pantoate--beta-alanine ligase [Nitrospiria bacterium]